MKKLTLTITFIIIGITLQALPLSSRLIINSNEGSQIKVSINNGPFSAPSSTVKLMDLPSGNHLIKVRRHSYFNGPIQNQLIYRGTIQIAPRTVTQAIINRFGNFAIRNIETLYSNGFLSNTTSTICGHKGCGLLQGHLDPCSITHSICTFNGCSLTHGHSGIHNFNYGSSSNFYTQNLFSCSQTWTNQIGYGIQCMNQSQFQTFKHTLLNQHFDNSRMQIARQVISQNHFSTSQISEILTLFDFESNKLELAKYSYGNTIDKENYYTLSNSFNFNSSINELMIFIRNV